MDVVISSLPLLLSTGERKIIQIKNRTVYHDMFN